MKITLTLDNGVRLSAPMSERSALEILDEFVDRLDIGGVTTGSGTHKNDCGPSTKVKATESLQPHPEAKATVNQQSHPEAKVAVSQQSHPEARQIAAHTHIPEAKGSLTAQYLSETKLMAFICAGCGGFRVIKVPRDTGLGDAVPCNCGHETHIQTIKRANGDCPNCGTRFLGLSVINGLMEIKCKNCKSPIDLTERSDGALTGQHNLKY